MSKNGLKGFVVGALIASAAALLFAPKSGTKTRNDIKKLIKTISKKMEKEFGDLSSLSQEKYESLVSAALKEYTKTSKVAKGFIEEAQDLFKKQWNDIKKEIKK